MSATQHCEKCGGPEPDLNVHPEIVRVRELVKRFDRALRAEVAATKEYYLLVQARRPSEARRADVKRRQLAMRRSEAGKALTAALLEAEAIAW